MASMTNAQLWEPTWIATESTASWRFTSKAILKIEIYKKERIPEKWFSLFAHLFLRWNRRSLDPTLWTHVASSLRDWPGILHQREQELSGLLGHGYMP